MAPIADTIDAEECAELLKCTPETVEELTRKGELPAVKFGRGWIYVRADLLAYLAEKGRRDAEERRPAFTSRCQAPIPAARLIKPRRLTPPLLPQPAIAEYGHWQAGMRRGR